MSGDSRLQVYFVEIWARGGSRRGAKGIRTIERLGKGVGHAARGSPNLAGTGSSRRFVVIEARDGSECERGES